MSTLKNCPTCHRAGVSTEPGSVANFFRCRECGQAAKLNENGRLVKWLNVWTAGTRAGKRHWKKARFKK